MSSNTSEGNGGGQAAGAIDDDAFRALVSDAASKKKELKKLKTVLLTPEASLEPDDERVKADKERIAKEEVALKEASAKVNVAADQKKKVAINRIISCPDEAYDDILNIRGDVKDKKLARDHSFVLLGCLIHPRFTLDDQAFTAYLKLHVAADRMDVDNSCIEAVKGWDGEEDIMNSEDDSEMPDANDNASQSAPELPTWVAEIHGKALEPLKQLFDNPNSPEAMSALNEIDQQIEKGVGGSESKEERAEWALKPNVFKLYFAELKRLDAISPEDPSHSTTKIRRNVVIDLLDTTISRRQFPRTWLSIYQDKDATEKKDDGTESGDVELIRPPWVLEIYGKATNLLQALRNNPRNSDTIKDLTSLNINILQDKRSDIGEDKRRLWCIAINEFSALYGQLDDIEKLLSTTPGDEKQIEQKNKTCEVIVKLIELRNYPKDWKYIHELKQMDYPWHTVPIGNTTSRIIGVREVGRGKQVCIEIMEGGCWIRRLEAASETEFGTQATEEYFAHEKSKNFSKGQSKWSKEEKSAFQKLHWVTRSQVKSKNKAAGRRAPAAYCCVEFDKGIIDIITVSSFRALRGRMKANSEIIEICGKHGFPVPWKAVPVSHYTDYSKLAETPEERRKLEDTELEPYKKRTAANGSEVNNKSRGVSGNEDRFQKLEDQIARLIDVFSTLSKHMGDRAVAQNVDLESITASTKPTSAKKPTT